VDATGEFCRCMKCKNIADDFIPMSIADGEGFIEGDLPVCSECKGPLLEGYRRLQAAAQELRDAGMTSDEVNRVMMPRVDAGEFQ
jgi:hypothetical protein